MSPCECGCGKTARGGGFNSNCVNECKCGCGGRTKYAYIPGHRKSVSCVRCGKQYSPIHNSEDPSRCSQCRRHVKDGRPSERDTTLITSRKRQSESPEGRRWCSGCERYRLLRFFGRNAEGYYSRCKPCARTQRHSTMLVKRYGISAGDYIAIKEAQGGKCAICQVATGASRSLAVDHDHTCCPAGTSCGQCVRALLCSPCNRLLGHLRDNTDALHRAITVIRDRPAQAVLNALDTKDHQ